MPAITKRKRTAPSTRGGSNTIQRYGKITKSAPLQAAVFKQLEVQDKPARKNDSQQSSNIRKNKRKADSLDDDQFATLHEENQLPPAAPVTPRKKARPTPRCIAETPTKGARSLFQAFSLTGSKPDGQTVQQLPTPPSSQESEDGDLPPALQQLVDLHSCLLTALSLHYAHNGRMAPADLRLLCPSVTRTWGVRKVEQKDVLRLLPLQSRQDGEEATFRLADYGQGKVCIELVCDNGRHNPVDEEILNARFVTNLEKAWKQACAVQIARPSPTEFVASLSLAPIKLISSISKAGKSLTKGQQLLTELKAGAIKVQERSLQIPAGNASSSNGTKPKLKDPFQRSMDLKSRIFAKQQLNESLPAQLTAEQIARRTALMRLGEIAPVLQSLALGKQRHRNDDAGDDPFRRVVSNVSFTMPTLVQNLQMSLRNPIEGRQATACVRLLADIAPEWIGVREIGNVIGVTVGGQGVGKVELARKVEDALSKI